MMEFILRKSIATLAAVLFMLNCGPKQDDVEKIIEDGVEIVINPLELARENGSRPPLTLQREFSIDTEDDSLAEVGFSNVFDFVVDSEGSIICVYEQIAPEYFFFKFDRDGNYVTRFGKTGQGPGELSMVGLSYITDRDEVFIRDMGAIKALCFSNTGKFLKEITLAPNISRITPLGGSKYLTIITIIAPEVEKRILSLCDAELKEIKKLDSLEQPDWSAAGRIRGIRYSIAYSESKENIFVGNTQRGYEFWVYDFEGNLIRKIRKEYKGVEIPKKFIDHTLETYTGERKDKVYFPEKFPPYRFFFADDEGRLFVMTYEKNTDKNEYMFDIFNADGMYIGRIGLRNFGRGSAISKIEWVFQVKVKNNRLYCIQEKENGYIELVVYQMNWKYRYG